MMLVHNNLLNLKDDNIPPIVIQLKQDFHSVDYYDIISYYYDVIAKRSIKQRYAEHKGMGLLRKLDEWEIYYEEKDEWGNE